MNDGDVGTAFLVGAFLAAMIGALLPNTAVYTSEWGKAVDLCEANGGVKYTRGSSSIRRQLIVCNNDARFTAAKTSED